ncbi:MAG: 50S ribosomal protein L10 [Gammaproteobacteria bacterium]
MRLNLEAKQAIVAEVAEVARSAHCAVAAEYAGLSVGQMTDLRNAARKASVYLRVVRNTLARRALSDTQFSCMREGLAGPLVLAFAGEDPGAAARVIDEFAKRNDKLVVRLVALGGKLLDPSAIKAVASLPTRAEAISRLMAVMQAPIAKLVRTLAEPHTRLVRVLAAVRDQKQAA